VASKISFALPAIGVALSASVGIVSLSAADDTTPASQGVYTKDQAARGKVRYFTACASCHGGLLQGDGEAPELAGKLFMKRWGNQPIAALFTFATTQMPIGRPGSLGALGYADVIAFILSNNGFPDGGKELPANESALENIIIEGKK
jgi:S-disulfanyl-L-cysteine oxidoreductase SoxD